MSIFHYAIDSKNEFIFGDFPSELAYLLEKKPSERAPIEVSIAGKKQFARFGWISNTHGTLYVLATEEKYLKSYKLFKILMEISVKSVESLSKLKNKIAFEQNDLTGDLLHNLTSQNSHSIQKLYALVPQNVISQNYNKQHDLVKAIIAEKPKVTADTLLDLIKINFAMKVEFTVFERTMKRYVASQMMEDSIRGVILSILPIFIADFDEKKIEVSLASSEKRLMVDYDSLSVSLYFILENAVKYCCRRTSFKIHFNEEEDCFSVVFDLVSVRIDADEVNKIFEKGYRSKHAVNAKINGNGIGMYRILKTLKLNNAVLEVTPRISPVTRSVGGILYEHNQFKIKFLNQQSWFAN